MQNTLLSAPTVACQGRIFQPMQDGQLGMIDARDIGEVATKVLTENGHEGEAYTLTGPAAISFYDVAAAVVRGSYGQERSDVRPHPPRERRRRLCWRGASLSGWQTP